ncbi:hypothetical protein [Prauserella sp. PE36]|uniref:hypothetical protein n=1 Tax=Prauserella sp. PE36 TaxID=1504709 RepID=UPI00131462C9|nr:hypothetical protein [Prauserella sp. PE36]
MDERVVHLLDFRSWWDGRAVMLCGAVFEAGNHEGVWITWGERMCQPCERAERGA